MHIEFSFIRGRKRIVDVLNFVKLDYFNSTYMYSPSTQHRPLPVRPQGH